MLHLVLHPAGMHTTQHNKATTPDKVNLIKLSADVHKRDYKISRQIGDQNIQPTQGFKPQEAYKWALKQFATKPVSRVSARRGGCSTRGWRPS